MARGNTTIYDSMEFPVYEYREYPKYVDNATRGPDGHGTGALVNSKQEEDAYWAKKDGKEAPLETEVEDA